MTTEFDPSEHPRDEEGQFTSGGGGYSKELSSDLLKLGERLEREHGVTLSLYSTNQGHIELAHISVPREHRKQGVGTAVMKKIVAYADERGKTVVLDPAVRDDSMGTTSQARLVKFYKQFGFRQNKGRRPEISAMMYRDSGAKVRESALFEAWDPEEHPRDDAGKFTNKGGADGGKTAGGAEKGRLQDGRRVPERPGVLAPQDRPAGRPLRGLPEGGPGPSAQARELAAEYVRSTGREYRPPDEYRPTDARHAERVAAAFDRMEDRPDDPEVKRAYGALARETGAQFEAMLRSGVEVEPIDFAKTGDPYGGKYEEMVRDVRENNHVWYFRTADGFGPPGEMEKSRHPLLAPTEYRDAAGNRMLANDVFRVVHDYFGHNKEGFGFDPDGEDNAWRSHLAMFSREAGRAMTTETRGQASWVYFGPHGADNREGKKPTVFAAQKAGLLPDFVREAWGEEKHPRGEGGKFAAGDRDPSDPEGVGPSEDEKDTHHAWAQAAGGRVNGYQASGVPGRPDYLVVTDRLTHSTGIIPLDRVSPNAIRAKFEDIRRRFADAEVEVLQGRGKRESVPAWGRERLVEVARVIRQPGDPAYAYAAVRLDRLVEVAVRGVSGRWCQSPWTARRISEGRCAVVRAPRRLLPKGAVSGRALEVLTESGWRPLAPPSARLVETEAGRRIQDSPTPRRLEVARWRPTRAVLDRHPAAESLQVPDVPGRLDVAAVDGEAALLHVLRAATGDRAPLRTESPRSVAAVRPRDYPSVVEQLVRESVENRRSGVEKDHLVAYRGRNLILAGSLVTGQVLWEADADDRGPDGRRVRFALMVPEGGKVWAVRVPGVGWCLPGGHREVGEARGAAAVREMVEETGLHCRLEGLAGRLDGPDHETVVFRGSRAPGAPDPVPQADEVEDVALVEPGDLCLEERYWVAKHLR